MNDETDSRFNKFSVEAQGDEIVILNLPLQARPSSHSAMTVGQGSSSVASNGPSLPLWPGVAALSVGEAINLAAWLVTRSGQRLRFLHLLEEIDDATR